MTAKFTLEYWQDDGWFVGRLREVPGVFSQGETLKELERNIRDAYSLVMKDIFANPKNGRTAPVPRHNEIRDSLCARRMFTPIST